MRTIFVDLQAAKNCQASFFYENQKLTGKLRQSILSRSKNGDSHINLKDAITICKSIHNVDSKRYLLARRIKYYLGDSLSNLLFPSIAYFDYSDALNEELQFRNIEYHGFSALYHITPVENYENIIKEGILPGKDKVFMTNLISYSNPFVFWKTLQLKQTTEYCIFKIDQKRLAERHKLYYYRINEIITDHVEPEYISIL